jgi:2-amino-4-hydroxy-6-hydroxymethyldihydropteridine diphosphokinase
MNHKVFLGLGTNLGNKLENLKSAINALCNIGCKKIDESFIYESKPWGFKSNNSFLNCVINVETDLSAHKLLNACKQIELNMGRKPKQGKGYESRIIDIDILYFDEVTINSKNLQIPHPQIKKRLFVVKPLLDVIDNNHIEFKELINNKLEMEKKENLEKFDTKYFF